MYLIHCNKLLYYYYYIIYYIYICSSSIVFGIHINTYNTT